MLRPYGACVVALGERTAGLMATDDATADLVLDAAEIAGEEVWQLPIPKEIRGKLDSKVADIRSVGHDRWVALWSPPLSFASSWPTAHPGLTSTLPDQRSSTASRTATSPQEGPGLASARSSRSLAHSRLDWPQSPPT